MPRHSPAPPAKPGPATASSKRKRLPRWMCLNSSPSIQRHCPRTISVPRIVVAIVQHARLLIDTNQSHIGDFSQEARRPTFPERIVMWPVSYTHLRAHETPEHL